MPQYQLKKTNVRRRNTLWVLALLSVCALSFAAYKFGYHEGNQDFHAYDDRITDLNEKMRELEEARLELKKKNALLKSADSFEQSEVAVLKEEVGRLEAKLVKQRKELVFYKSLLDPENQPFGLYIQSVKLKSIGDNSYAYTIILAQAKQSSPQVRGKILVSVQGENGTTLIKGSQVGFKFKFFQRFDGTLSFKPEDKPVSLTVDVKPSTRRIKDVKQSYHWGTLMGE